MQMYYVDVRALLSEIEKDAVIQKFDTNGWTVWARKIIATHEFPQVSKTIYAQVSYDLPGDPIFPDIPSNCRITTYEPSF